MKIRTVKLSGSALNWAVARCTKESKEFAIISGSVYYGRTGVGVLPYAPCENAQQGLHLLEEYRISTSLKHHGYWFACIYDVNDEPTHQVLGSTVLEAAMRCLVVSILGDIVDIPEELAE